METRSRLKESVQELPEAMIESEAAATEGEANAALVRFIAAMLRVALRDVSLLAGASARLKRVRVAGAGARLAAALEKICAMG